MKKILNNLAAVVSLALLCVSCDKVGGDVPLVQSTGNVLVLNNGNWGGNDACLTSYNLKTGDVAGGAFMATNGQALGDLAQDILVDSGNIYVAVYGSQLIFVIDKDLKLKKTVIAENDGMKLSPRAMVKGGDKLYVTYYEGYLGEIDPDNGYEVRIVKVGSNPDGLAYADGKVYVANSGGMNYPDYDNTVSVVDATSFAVTSTIQVNVNPAKVFASGNHVFVSSFGNYADAPAKLQCIDARTCR